ncbi:MAG: hypothetical protein AAGF12_03850 [Myxococcota bacterium]
MAVVLLVGFLLVVVSIALTIRGSRTRWGFVVSETRGGDSPYREGALPDHRAAGVPKRIVAICSLNIVWGLATIFLFAPAGVLVGLVLMDESANATPLGLLLLLVALSGFPVGILHAAGGYAVIQREALSRKIMRWSVGHHIAVTLAYFLTAAVMTDWALLWVITVVLCVLGASLVLGLYHGSRVTNAELGRE